jgi:serine/threonine protein kinase
MQRFETTFDNRMSTMKDFEVIKQVGKGSYGVVYKVRRKSDSKIYAIKTISLSTSFIPPFHCVGTFLIPVQIPIFLYFYFFIALYILTIRENGQKRN